MRGYEPPEELLTPAEVADIFRVDPKTVTRWAKMGKLSYFMTIGGHRRYPKKEVMALYHSTRKGAVRETPQP